jgi:hypothetical protein
MEKELKHTPGPWEVVGSNGTVGVGLRIFADTRFIGFVGNSDEEAEQCSANAHLIAAAPDLLDILVRAKDVIEALDGTSVENEKLVDDYRAAIAKAEGRAV